jgi:hypothetical protein
VLPAPVADPVVAPPAELIAASAPPAVVLDPAEVAAGISLSNDGVVVPAAAYRTLLQAATEAGRRQTDDTLRERISKLGFTDVTDLLEQIETRIANPQESTVMATPAAPAPPTPAPTTPTPAPAAPPAAAVAPTPAPAGTQPTPAQIAAAANDPTNDRRLPEHVRQRVVKFRDEMRGRADAAEAQARTHADQVTSLTSQLAAQRAAEGMKIQLVQAGMREIEFGWFKLEATLAALKADPSPEAQAKLKAFDVAAWAAEQRKAQPFLFGEQPVPATTPGPEGAAPVPGAPDPAAVTGNAAGAGSFDARTADPKAFRERMEKHGFRYTGSGPPMKR